MAFLRAGVLGPPLVLPGVIACVGRRPSNWILSALSCLRPLFGLPAFYHLYFVLLRAGIFVALRNSSLLYHPYLSFGMMPCLHYRRTHRETAPYLKSLSCVYSVCTALWGAFYCLVQQTCLHTSRVPVSDNRRTAVDPRQCSTPCIPSCVGSLFDYTQSGPGQQWCQEEGWSGCGALPRGWVWGQPPGVVCPVMSCHHTLLPSRGSLAQSL